MIRSVSIPTPFFSGSLFTPSPELIAAVRERAQQEADERGVPIDQICIQATPWGKMTVHVLDD